MVAMLTKRNSGEIQWLMKWKGELFLDEKEERRKKKKQRRRRIKCLQLIEFKKNRGWLLLLLLYVICGSK